jgi:hypothetical protein
MKRTLAILLSLLLLAACQPTPEQPVVVQKDTERLVDTVVNQSPDGTASADTVTDAPGFVKSEEHYTYDYQSGNGRLTIHADADVYLPASGRISMARVRPTVFTDEWIKTSFDRIFEGETAWTQNPDRYIRGKKEIAEYIVYIQELIDTGRTDEKLLTEEEAIEYIEALKQEYATAPDETIQNDALIIVDGSVRTQTYDNGINWIVNRMMDARNADHWLQITNNTTPEGIPLEEYFSYGKGNGESNISYAGFQEEGYILSNWYDPYTHRTVYSDEAECLYGQSFSPADAVQRCRDFLAKLDVTDVMPYRTCDLYTATVYGQVKSLYIIPMVRTAAGSPVAYIPQVQELDTDPYSTPWYYESMLFFVDDDGINLCQWSNPIEVKEILSTDVQTIPFEEAASIFEHMCSVAYEARTLSQDGVAIYYDLYPATVELSLFRIKEQNSETKIGLYVPAWVFYGKSVKQYRDHKDIHPDDYTDVILFAINAVDGSIIDLNNGY